MLVPSVLRPSARWATPALVAYRSLSTTATRQAPLTIKKELYTAKATATGAGRNGTVKSEDNGEAPLSLKLSTPKPMGGQGDGQNPEQLFAMGYASCFLGALQLTAKNAGKADIAANAKIHTSVSIGPPEQPPLPGFGLRVTIEVEGVDDDKIIGDTHEFCPYSRLIKHGAQVTVKKI
ncbi:OsmC-domain-containing protein [Punctularia strigosozonata HHB-11173 SS5]|uniref:OsmC-domain-containing protein n=1 Tax=Punctularia strigosozonata (strain HHB-11173) TaxID=741275 RepID=UPI0004417909|nr:OsmC-domain-containing protein [Punctularia strigosozonata HHB-11173 SS5]EIN10539.1 OsmC-domain-containing protein [Punctularia strigosozonata HHB-11173 SS5]